MQGSAKSKLLYIIIFLLLPLFFVLYYQEQKQSYESKVAFQQSMMNELCYQKQLNEQKIALQSLIKAEEFVPMKDTKIDLNGINVRRISITNGITKEMLTYKHWTGSYAPTTFVITIGENQISYNETTQIEIGTEKNIVIRYDYSFVNGYKTGSREIEFIISPEKSDYVLRFAWQEPAHLVLENASIKKATVVPFNKSLEQKKM